MEAARLAWYSLHCWCWCICTKVCGRIAILFLVTHVNSHWPQSSCCVDNVIPRRFTKWHFNWAQKFVAWAQKNLAWAQKLCLSSKTLPELKNFAWAQKETFYELKKLCMSSKTLLELQKNCRRLAWPIVFPQALFPSSQWPSKVKSEIIWQLSLWI